MTLLLMKLGLLIRFQKSIRGNKMFGLKNSVLGRTFKTIETTGAYGGGRVSAPTGMASGLVTGTRVATNIGWRMVEAIAPGDLALTFDGGMQTVVRVERSVLWSSPRNCPEHLWPLEVPAGALGNQRDMYLLPEQNVMVESDAAEDCFGDPFALIPAAALTGFCGITRVKPHEEIVVYTLHFKQEQIVFACSGALFHCPADDQGCLLDMGQKDATYQALSMNEATMLVECMELEINAASAPDMAQFAAVA